MTGFPNSTIAALCYANPTDIDFAALTAELGKALWANPERQLDIRNTYDDFVVFDLATMRITIAQSDLLRDAARDIAPPAYAEVIVVAVGPGDDSHQTGPDFDDRAALCQGLIAKITERKQADRMIVREHPGVFTEDAHDVLVEDLATPRGQVLREGPDRATEDMMWEMATRAWDQGCDPTADCVDAEVIDVEPVRPTHAAAAADPSGARAQKRAQAAGPGQATGHDAGDDAEIWDGDIDAQPLLHRAAVNSLNAAMLVFALPVGAALVTLSVLGRESLGLSSRITAVTGAGMGVANTETAQTLLSYFS